MGSMEFKKGIGFFSHTSDFWTEEWETKEKDN